MLNTTISEIMGDNYPIFIGDKSLENLNAFLKKYYSKSKFVIIVDQNTINHCLPTIIANVDQLKKADIIEIEDGENNKNIEICTQIWHTLSDSKIDRKSLIINVGGGVVTDMGGFVAAAFKRGIDFINIPTTLLAQVDAAIGGKTSVNLKTENAKDFLLKNEIGFFKNPKAVVIYPTFLKTISQQQLISGYAEMIKHALITDKKHWEELKQLKKINYKILKQYIVNSIQIKNKIVLLDPTEKNIREALNFGHTIGHAIESASHENGKKLLHGEAIAIGIICEAFLSYKKNFLNINELNEIKNHIHSIFGTVTHLEKIKINDLIELMKHDKKNKKNTIKFTLLNGIGATKLSQTCSIPLIKEALSYYTKNT